MVEFSYPNYLTPRIRIGIAVCMFLLAVAVQSLPIVAELERALYDARIRLVSATDEPVDNIVIVAVDDESLERMEPAVKRWPWPRFVHGLVFDYCSEAKVIGVDILFPEGQWKMWADDPGDPSMVEAVARTGNVMLAAHFSDEMMDEAPPEALTRFALSASEADRDRLPAHRHAMVPFPELLATCAGVGSVNVQRDADGKVRSYRAVERYQDRVYPSLALAAVARYLDLEHPDLILQDSVLHAGDRAMALDPDGSFPYAPSFDDHPVISAADVISSWNAERAGEQPAVSREQFRDRIVIFGMTALGVRDQEITSLADSTAGVKIMASAIDNLLRGIRFTRPGTAWTLAAMALLALIPARFMYEQPKILVVMALSLLAGYVAIAVGAVLLGRVMLPMTGPVFALGLSCTGIGILSWGQERARRKYMEALDVAKQEFTDMLVHDLKNTVAPIIMSLTMIGVGRKQKGDSSEADDRFLRQDFPEIVSTSANKLMTQINALLDIRRMQEGRLQLKQEAWSPSDLVRRTENEFQVPVQRAELELRVSSAVADGVFIQVDPLVFDRIMGNIIWNAVKYARQGTTLEILSDQMSDGRVRISVANEGKAIPADLQESLFTAFTTGPSSERRGRIPSTGLGLTFCKLAAEAHGAEIKLLSPRSGCEEGVEVLLYFQTTPPSTT